VTADDLAEILRLAEVDPTYFHLFGPTADEGLCLLRMGRDWQVFVSERGERYEERTFPTEDEACVYFLKRIFQLWRRRER
jgi:hypothetical protein